MSILHGKIKVDKDAVASWEIMRVIPVAAVEPSDDTVCTYRCVYIRRGHPLSFLMEPLEFELQHRYGDGGSKLVSKMLARVAGLEDETR